jgi:hypothetical protein
MLVNITCPKCNTSGGFSITDAYYIGPYKCWKCRAVLKINLENNRLVSCEAMDAAEQARFDQEQEAKKRARGGR